MKIIWTMELKNDVIRLWIYRSDRTKCEKLETQKNNNNITIRFSKQPFCLLARRKRKEKEHDAREVTLVKVSNRSGDLIIQLRIQSQEIGYICLGEENPSRASSSEIHSKKKKRKWKNSDGWSIVFIEKISFADALFKRKQQASFSFILFFF